MSHMHNAACGCKIMGHANDKSKANVYEQELIVFNQRNSSTSCFYNNNDLCHKLFLSIKAFCKEATVITSAFTGFAEAE